MPLNQRPREKALQKGIETLSDSELLAIILKIILLWNYQHHY